MWNVIERHMLLAFMNEMKSRSNATPFIDELAN